MVPPQGSSCCGLCGAQIPGSLRIQSQAAPGALWISWRGDCSWDQRGWGEISRLCHEDLGLGGACAGVRILLGSLRI